MLKRKVYLILRVGMYVLLVVLLVNKGILLIEETKFKHYNYQNIEALSEPANDEGYQFAVTSKVESNLIEFKEKVIPSINENPNIKLVISPGNAVLDGEENKFLELYHLLEEIRAPNLVGIGRGEISDTGAKNYYRNFGEYYYSFGYRDSYFIFLDTTGKSYLKQQEEWLQAQLETSTNYEHTFVFSDLGPIESEHGEMQIDSEIASELRAIFEQYRVSGVFYNGDQVQQAKVGSVMYYSTGNVPEAEGNGESNGYYLITVGDELQVDFVTTSNSNHYRLHQYLDYLFSVIYFNASNFLITITIIILIIMFLQKRIPTDVDYYPSYEQITGDEPNAKLKIAMFTNNYYPFIGGVPISIDLLARELRAQGHTVTIFAPMYPGTTSDEFVYRTKLLLFKKSGNFNFAIANIFSRDLKREFNRQKFDVVHVHHPFWFGSQGLKLARKQRIPVVLTYHTRLELYSANLPVCKNLFKNVLSHKMIYRFCQRCDGIIAPTKSAATYLENIRVGTRKLVTPTGVDFKKYQTNHASDVRMRYNITDEVLLCSVSRLSVEKNIDFLLEGLVSVKAQTNVKFKCLIVGTGPDYEHLQARIKALDLSAEVILVGAVAPERVVAYYQAADLFVFSSKSETQGMVILEAMAGRCPVVCINASGIDDIVESGINGYKTGDNQEEWKQRVIELIEDQKLREHLSENAYATSKQYTTEAVERKISEFYRLVINKYHGGNGNETR